MPGKRRIKYIHEGRYVVAVEVELLEDDKAWSPYLSAEDAYKLDDVRSALRRGDLETAGKYGRPYQMHPLDGG